MLQLLWNKRNLIILWLLVIPSCKCDTFCLAINKLRRASQGPSHLILCGHIQLQEQWFVMCSSTIRIGLESFLKSRSVYPRKDIWNANEWWNAYSYASFDSRPFKNLSYIPQLYWTIFFISNVKGFYPFSVIFII